MTYKACKYGNKWAVLDTSSRVYYFIGTSKRFCQTKANELNKGI